MPPLAIACAVALLVSGCAVHGPFPARIPYDLESVPTLASPAHPLRLAVLPLVDAQLATEAADPSGRFMYRGIEYAATRLERLGDDPLAVATEVLARHLAKSRVFAQVILVSSAEQAPEADLILSGELVRFRGYVEAQAPHRDSGRPSDRRWVLSEVVLNHVQIRAARAPGATLIDLDVGWSTFEERKLEDGAPPDPWVVLAQTLQVALRSLSDELAKADLTGAFVVRDAVSFEAAPTVATATAAFGLLPERAPEGWRFVRTSSAAVPSGWKGAPRCVAAKLVQIQTLRFHRALGPYQPTVSLWACPVDAGFVVDDRAERSAVLLGHTTSGLRYFSQSVGKKNWKDPEAQLRQHLSIQAPARHTFQVP